MQRVQSTAPCIAIDGPGASGKTVIGKGVARRLGYRFVDTGTMYRAVTWLALLQGTPLGDHDALSRTAQALSLCIGREPEDGGSPRVVVNGKDTADDLHSPQLDRSVSAVSAVPGVRRAMVQLQRSMAEEGRLVMAGRDIGTVVLPDASLKVFLLASSEERARRRHAELLARGVPIEYEAVLSDLRRRDRLDSERDLSPLTPAEDAWLVDTDGHTVEHLIELIVERSEQG